MTLKSVMLKSSFRFGQQAELQGRGSSKASRWLYWKIWAEQSSVQESKQPGRRTKTAGKEAKRQRGKQIKGSEGRYEADKSSNYHLTKNRGDLAAVNTECTRANQPQVSRLEPDRLRQLRGGVASGCGRCTDWRRSRGKVAFRKIRKLQQWPWHL